MNKKQVELVWSNRKTGKFAVLDDVRMVFDCSDSAKNYEKTAKKQPPFGLCWLEIAFSDADFVMNHTQRIPIRELVYSVLELNDDDHQNWVQMFMCIACHRRFKQFTKEPGIFGSFELATKKENIILKQHGFVTIAEPYIVQDYEKLEHFAVHKHTPSKDVAHFNAMKTLLKNK